MSELIEHYHKYPMRSEYFNQMLTFAVPKIVSKNTIFYNYVNFLTSHTHVRMNMKQDLGLVMFPARKLRICLRMYYMMVLS